MPISGAGILGIDPVIGQPIEGHRRAAGSHHANHNAQMSRKRKTTI